MAFDEAIWREKLQQRFRRWRPRAGKLAADSLYLTLAGAALWPAAQAYQAGDPQALFMLGSFLAGVGGNLFANAMQKVKDEADTAVFLQTELQTNLANRDPIDTLLEKLDVVQQAQADLADDDRAWFRQTLQQELAQWGNLPRFEAKLGKGAAAAMGKGATAVSQQGVVARDVAGSIHTGNQYIEHYHAAPATPSKDAWRVAYLNRILYTAGQLSLAGIDPKATSRAQARLRLSAVYTALLTYGVEEMRQLRDWQWGMRLTGGRQLSALAQLNRHQHLVLLGDPGSGKSTFIQFVALCLAGDNLDHEEINLDLLTSPLPNEQGNEEEERQPWHNGRLLPSLVILRDFAARGLPPVGEPATANHLWQFMTADLQAASLGEFAPIWQQEWLNKGGILFLDGLDEVPQANQRREQIKQAIESFAMAYPQLRIVVTSRTYAYQQAEWQLPTFATAVLAPFSAGQIRYFITRWYAHLAPLRGWHLDDARGRGELLKQTIFKNDRLYGLAERPLLLTLMASLHAWRGGSLPEKREELYANTVDLLLDWWEDQRIVRNHQGEVVIIQPSLAEWLKIDREKVRRLLHQLAYDAHAAQPDLVGTADIAEETLVIGLMRLNQNPDVKPARLVEYLTDRAGLLLPRGVGVYTFPHRTFQEYLAACYLTDHEYPDAIATLVCADPNRWREVALLAGAKAWRGATASLWSLVEALCYQEPTETAAAAWGAQLAGQALVEMSMLDQVASRHQPKVDRVKRWLVAIVTGAVLPANERVQAAVHLADLGDPRPEVMTTQAMSFCFVPPGPFCMGSDEDNPIEKDAERPLHQVDIADGYWLGRFPVTNAQFAEFVAARGYHQEAYWAEAAAEGLWREGETRGWTWVPEKEEGQWLWRNKPYDYGRPFNLANHPVIGVTWYESLAFCRWLTASWHAAGVLPKTWAVCLPSEAEWEKGVRGGLEIPLKPLWATGNAIRTPNTLPLHPNPEPQRNYVWGKMPPQIEWANYEQSGIGSSSGCGCFSAAASVYGCEEMAGNVFEWTRSVWGRYDREKSQGNQLVFDPHFTYPYVVGDAREQLTHNSWWPRTLRGGAWAGDEEWLRCAYRLRSYPHDRNDNLGFRVVVVPIFP